MSWEDLAGNQKKKLKWCAGWPGMWGAPAPGAGWSYGSPHLLGGGLLGYRHGKALLVWSHTVHNALCLLDSELGTPSMWNHLPIISNSLHGHSMNCWTGARSPDLPPCHAPPSPSPPRDRGKSLSTHSLWLIFIHNDLVIFMERDASNSSSCPISHALGFLK